MKTNPAANIPLATPMDDDNLDRLLQAHLASPNEQLEPSSGFALSVMEAIQHQTSEPPPIPFPWRRVVPGAIALLCALAASLLFAPGLHLAAPEFPHSVTRQFIASSALGPGGLVLCCVLAAACISVAAVAASFRLAGRGR